MKTILLDLDGVMTDFISAVLTLWNKRDEYDPHLGRYPLGVERVDDVLGVQSDVLWGRIDNDIRFWPSLKMMPWGRDLYDQLSECGKVFFCTSPSRNSSSASGKVMWIQRHFGLFFRNYILTGHKHLLAKPDTVLIDDRPSAIQKFTEHGGTGILFPAPSNGQQYPPHDTLVSQIIAQVVSA